MISEHTVEPDLRTITTHCPYCAFQCSMDLAGTPDDLQIIGSASFPVNKGALCIKGWTAGAALAHPERLRTPLMRGADGELHPASWEAALERIAQAFLDTRAAYGPEAVGIFGGGSLTNEKSYLLGKFARVALQTPNIDYNGRFCMSSAAAASIRALGIDRGLPFPLEDIAGAETILMLGSNSAETMPPIMQYFEAQRENGGKLIVADPRLTPTAQRADLHLRLIPGTDAALANGLLHILVRDGLIDADYIAERTEGFEPVRNLVATYWPERVERITGVPEAQLLRAARMLGSAASAMILTGRGAEQQSQGVNNVLSFINVALALGLIGHPNSGYGCLTGQGNGQGGREHGQKADQLPGYRLITDPAARRHVAAVWGVDEESLPGPGKSAYELLDSLGRPDSDGSSGVRALLVMGSNVVVSAPNVINVEKRLQSLDFLVVSDFFLSETAALADVVLPSAQWAEEEGTMTNLEGRVIRRRRAFVPPAGVRDDVTTICKLAWLLGKGSHFDYSDTGEIFAELGRASAGGPADYSGITYDKIEAQYSDGARGIFWPCPGPDHPGTPRMFADGFPTASGKAKFHAVRHAAPAEEPDAEYPLYLTTGRNLAQYQSGTQTRRIAELSEMTPMPLAEMHPLTAQRYGIGDGDPVRVCTRRGAADFTVKITRNIREDTIFAPFHWGGMQAVNRLTNPALDPTSRMPEFKICAARIETISPVIPAKAGIQ
ncbi:MAG: molybdopterin oxidoreductase family protein [Chloroflexi bacterium]|nr:molybdopterin oxidoreductase family protein [Chloroflexota bacterium]